MASGCPTAEGPGRHAIFTVPAAGGTARVVHRFESEHDFPGLAMRRDGTEVAFIAPAPEGYFQLFRMSVRGGAATQVTFDPAQDPANLVIGRSVAGLHGVGLPLAVLALGYRVEIPPAQSSCLKLPSVS